MNQLHANPIAHVDTLEALNHLPFDRHVEKPGPRAFGRSSRDDGIELFSDS